IIESQNQLEQADFEATTKPAAVEILEDSADIQQLIHSTQKEITDSIFKRLIPHTRLLFQTVEIFQSLSDQFYSIDNLVTPNLTEIKNEPTEYLDNSKNSKSPVKKSKVEKSKPQESSNVKTKILPLKIESHPDIDRLASEFLPNLNGYYRRYAFLRKLLYNANPDIMSSRNQLQKRLLRINLSKLSLNTDLEAVAVKCLLLNRITICNIYLPNSQYLDLQQLENLKFHHPKPYLANWPLLQTVITNKLSELQDNSHNLDVEINEKIENINAIILSAADDAIPAKKSSSTKNKYRGGIQTIFQIIKKKYNIVITKASINSPNRIRSAALAQEFTENQSSPVNCPLLLHHTQTLLTKAIMLLWQSKWLHTLVTHQHIFEKNAPAECDTCKVRLNIPHILSECPSFIEKRRKNISQEIKIMLTDSREFNKVINFLKDIKLNDVNPWLKVGFKLDVPKILQRRG
ncbi:hypothetical protein TSAR_008491, partial [Trichomalopsis sarcophagae]